MKESKKSTGKHFKYVEMIFELVVEENKKINFISGLCNNGKVVYIDITDDYVRLEYGVEETQKYIVRKKPLKGQNEDLYKCFISRPDIFNHVVSLLVKEILKK
jgi:hypothetical protein